MHDKSFGLTYRLFLIMARIPPVLPFLFIHGLTLVSYLRQTRILNMVLELDGHILNIIPGGGVLPEQLRRGVTKICDILYPIYDLKL